MEAKKSHAFLSSVVLLLSSFMLEASAKTHREAFNQHWRRRLSPSSSIDKSPFKPGLDQLPKPQGQEGLKEKDRIQKLPGQPPVAFKQYGGYITIDESAGRAFYYYFTEAQDPAKAKDLPLVLWLNGGPGCSSIGIGAFQELGPFRVGSDGKTLFKNKFAWNHAANVLFLESPAGVGFSYSNTTSDYEIGGDKKTADDNYIFLMNWLERFPEYKGRDFYICGESYAGHFVPQLAQNILHHNKGANTTIINLKGIMVGNGVINDETDSRGIYEYWASHALISQEILKDIKSVCNFSIMEQSQECKYIVNIVDASVDQDINVYNLYSPRCLDGNLTATPKHVSIMNIEPCADSYTRAYFNNPDVQEAMHANVTKITYGWEECSDFPKNWTDRPITVLPIFRELMTNGIRVWKYSGDVDGRVPVTGTEYSLEAMNVPIVISWASWFFDGEVGGYFQQYEENLTFVTVRGAGHQVPSHRPDRSLSLVSHFLENTPFPDH